MKDTAVCDTPSWSQQQLGVLRAHLCGSGVGSGVTTLCSQGTSLW